MVVTTARMSLKEFLSYEDETDTVYELENGERIATAPESYLNNRIASFLLIYFSQIGILPECLHTKVEVAVSGLRATVRVPDLTVLSEELVAALEGATRATVMLEMPPPRLVVEVVSPGKKNIDRDYRYKKSQYEARGIEEYWIVDPVAQKVTVFSLVEGLYETAVFEGDAVVESGLLAALKVEEGLTAARVLRGGK